MIGGIVPVVGENQIWGLFLLQLLEEILDFSTDIREKSISIILDEDGFFLCTDETNKSSTSKDGIFIAGTAEGPKTIAASMAHAGHAASEAMKYLGVTE